MGSAPRLVATDLDGTLVRSDGSVSAYTREVLLEVEHLGVPVVFVTGRPLRWTEEVFHLVGGHGIAILSNGALVWDVAGGAAVRERLLSPEATVDIAGRIRQAVPGSSFAVEALEGIALEEEFRERYGVPHDARRGPIEQIADRAVLKLLARHERIPPQEYWDAADAVVGADAVITWSSTTSLLEISAPGVTKATTLELVCADLGVDAADVVAFGDMPNDLAMLHWAGQSYAVADAEPRVLAMADRVAPSNDDDGVARVLADLFGLTERFDKA